MATEEIVEELKPPVVEGEQVEEVELSPEEEKAYAKGWRPEAEWNGDEELWIGAKEFLGRQPLFDGLNKANKKITSQDKVIAELVAHNKKVQAAAVAQAKEELKREKAEAMKNQDYDAFVDIEEKAKELDKQEQEIEQGGETSAQEPQVFLDWKEDNSWYDTDKKLRFFADGVGGEIQNANPNMPVEELYAEVTKAVKEEYPEKFSKPAPRRGNPSGGGAPGGASNKGSGRKFAALNSVQKEVLRQIQRNDPEFTVDEYYDQLDQINAIDK